MPTLLLDEITTPNSIVSIFARQRDQGFYIIEPIGIRKWTEYDATPDTSTLPLIRTLGYTIAAFYYYSPVLRKEFLFLLKNNGVLEIINENITVMDTLKTGIIPTSSTEYIFKYDDINNRLFVNLTADAIYAVELRIRQENLEFIHNDKASLHFIHQFSFNIVDFDISFHFNEYMGEEFQSIAILFKDNAYSNIFTKIIYKVNPRKSKIDQKWDILLPNISLGINSEEYLPRSCLIETIPNIGFVVVTSSGFLFLTLPHGPQNFINDFVIPDILDQKDEFLINSNNKNPEEQGNLWPISLRKNIGDRVITFEIVTVDNKRAIINFTKVREEDEKYIIYWKQDLKVSVLSADEADNSTKLQYCSFIDSTKLDYTKISNNGNISIESFDKNTKPFHLTLQENKTIYGSMSSNIIDNYVGTGINYARMASFTVVKHPFKNFFDYEEITPEQTGNLVCFNSCGDENICQVKIRKYRHEDDKVCRITKKLFIKWSTTDKVFPLNRYEKSTHFVLDSMFSFTGNNVTVVGVNNEIFIIEDYTRVLNRIKLQENVKIYSIFLCEYELKGSRYQNIWVSDLNGFLWVVDRETGKIIDTIKLHHKALEICDSWSLGRSFCGPIIYGGNCMILSRTQDNGIELFYVNNIPFEFETITPVFQNDTYIVRGEKHYKIKFKEGENQNQNAILECIPIDSNLLVIKYVRLSPFSPYLICVAIDPIQNISYLKLFNLNKEKFIHSIDLTKLYPQAIVTDITTIPYIVSGNTTFDIERESRTGIHYAEKLILDQCFVISLNYEISEYEDNDNILLYCLDEELGQIIFQNGIKTETSISCLTNFRNNYFIASGNSIELFKVNYSVKWNSFLIQAISNKLDLNGLIKNVVTLDAGSEKYRLLLLDLFRGFRDIKMSQNLAISKETKDLIYEFEFVTSNDEYAIINDTKRSGIISGFESVEVNDNRWFIVSLNSNKVKIYYHNKITDEYSSNGFSLPNDILNISAVNDKRYEYWQGKDRERFFTCQNVLFVITTKNGGTYKISLVGKEVKLSRRKKNALKRHLEFITGEEEESEEEEYDEDEDDADDEDEIKLIDNKIISEYSLNL